MANDTVPTTPCPVKTEVVSFSVRLKNALEEAASVKDEMDTLPATAELSTEEHNVTLTNMRKNGGTRSKLGWRRHCDARRLWQGVLMKRQLI